MEEFVCLCMQKQFEWDVEVVKNAMELKIVAGASPFLILPLPHFQPIPCDSPLIPPHQGFGPRRIFFLLNFGAHQA